MKLVIHSEEMLNLFYFFKKIIKLFSKFVKKLFFNLKKAIPEH